MISKRILCVDDEPFNLDILEERLTDEGYEVQLAEDGTEAWDALNRTPEAFEAVLLDRMMPDMDGLEVLQKAKAMPELSAIPIIMQTARASNEDIREGLEAGAHYYLTKPFEKKTLLAIVNTAVDDYRRFRAMQDTLKETTSTLSLMEQGQFIFKRISEARSLASLLANATPNPSKVVLGLSELMINAVEHGNLGITYDEKTVLHESSSLTDEIERRLDDSAYRDRNAMLKFRQSPNKVVFEIIDEGDGFEWEKYMDTDPERAFDNHGRGIMMANKLSFDTLEYCGKGNHVIATFNLS